MSNAPLGRLSAAIDEFRSLYPDAPILSFQVFLMIATHQGISSPELIRQLNVSQSSISRHLMILSTWTWQDKRPGLDLIETVEDAMDRRTKISILTAKGRALACSLIRILEPDSDIHPMDFAHP